VARRRQSSPGKDGLFRARIGSLSDCRRKTLDAIWDTTGRNGPAAVGELPGNPSSLILGLNRCGAIMFVKFFIAREDLLSAGEGFIAVRAKRLAGEPNDWQFRLFRSIASRRPSAG
jgi:hypothetical protein